MPKRLSGIVIAATVAVAAWRVAALLLAFAQADSPAGSRLVQTLLALAGVTYLVCGLVVFRRVPGMASGLFVAFCICSGLHWGGPLELAPGALRSALILLYVLVSGILGAAFFLHLALWFPRKSRLAGKQAWIRLLYAPIVVAALLAAAYLVAPAGSDFRSAAEASFLILHTLVSNLFSVVAFVLFASHLFRAGLNRTHKRYVGLIVAGMALAWLPYLAASAAGVATDPWNLTVVALPISFTIAFFGIDQNT